MCFVLYAGTSHAMTQTEWRKDAPDLSVNLLTERENPIAAHFSKPHVQNIGSTSGCGCNFPHVTFQNGGWPSFDDSDPDPEQEASDRYNRERIVTLLRETGEATVELYGVWDGNFDFTMPPKIREQIPVDTILQPDFQFKEGAFYVVGLKRPPSANG
jgi:hypothetical protein